MGSYFWNLYPGATSVCLATFPLPFWTVLSRTNPPCVVTQDRVTPATRETERNIETIEDPKAGPLSRVLLCWEAHHWEYAWLGKKGTHRIPSLPWGSDERKLHRIERSGHHTYHIRMEHPNKMLCIWVWTTFPWQSWLQDLVPQELSLHQHHRNRSGYFQGRQTVVTRLPAKNIYLEWVLSLTHWAQVTALLSAVISDSKGFQKQNITHPPQPSGPSS